MPSPKAARRMRRRRTHAPRRLHGGFEPLESRQLLAGTGLTGTYYDNMDFTGLSFTQVDPVIDFDFMAPRPTVDPMIYPETFSVIWTGEVQAAAASEQYQFHTVSDDGVRLWLDVNQDGAFDESERIIDNFTF